MTERARSSVGRARTRWEPDPDKATIVNLDPADVLTTAELGKKLAPLIKPPPSFDELEHEATLSELAAP